MNGGESINDNEEQTTTDDDFLKKYEQLRRFYAGVDTGLAANFDSGDYNSEEENVEDSRGKNISNDVTPSIKDKNADENEKTWKFLSECFRAHYDYDGCIKCDKCAGKSFSSISDLCIHFKEAHSK